MGLQPVDLSTWQVFVDELLHCHVLCQCEGVYLAVKAAGGVGFQFNGVVPLSGTRELLCGFIAEDMGVLMVLWGNNLIPGLGRFVGGVLS